MRERSSAIISSSSAVKESARILLMRSLSFLSARTAMRFRAFLFLPLMDRGTE